MAEKWRTEKKRPKIKVLPWPAIPHRRWTKCTPVWTRSEGVLTLVESAVRQQFNATSPSR